MFPGTHTRTRVCYPQKPLCCLTDRAGVGSFNYGETSPGEASPSSILSSVLAHSAHQHDTYVGQRRGNAAYSSHSGEQKKKCNGSSLWLDKSLATFKEQQF